MKQRNLKKEIEDLKGKKDKKNYQNLNQNIQKKNTRIRMILI
jgi:hypothetical protein